MHLCMYIYCVELFFFKINLGATNFFAFLLFSIAICKFYSALILEDKHVEEYYQCWCKRKGDVKGDWDEGGGEVGGVCLLH